MRALLGLKITPIAPDTNSVWLTGNTLRYFNNGAWQQVGGSTFDFNMPQVLQAPALVPVVTSPTNIQLNYTTLNRVGKGYINTPGYFFLPTATSEHAGVYPASHFSRVENVPDDLNTILAGINTTFTSKADLVNGVIPDSQLPSYVDEIIEAHTKSDLPTIGDATKIYYVLTGTPEEVGSYRWTGSLYAPLNSQLTLGETVSTAYRGDRGKAAYEHTGLTNNPHNVTKLQIGLSNVDNTSDNDKPLSTLQQTALTDLYTVLNGRITTHVNDQANPHKTKLSLGIKFSVIGVSVVIPTNSTYNLMQLLNLTDKVVFTGNVNVSEYSLVNAGTANALLKLPNIDSFVDYTIAVRLTGTVGAGEGQREFYIDLRRANDTVVEGRAILKLNSTSLDRRGISFESASLDSSDNFITSGIKLVVNNPATGSASITLTGVEILIKGNY